MLFLTIFLANQDDIARTTALLAYPAIIYAQLLPALNCLSFSKDAVEVVSEFFKGESVNSLTELELPHKLEDPVIILHALRKFPKLKKLRVPAVKQIVNAVYELAESVEEFTIQIVDHSSPTVDELLTGYSHTMMRHLAEEQLEQLEAADLEPNKFLQKLKVLRLMPVYINARIKITDISCRLVLLKLNALTCLDFRNGGRPSGISMLVMQRMRDKFTVWYKPMHQDWEEDSE